MEAAVSRWPGEAEALRARWFRGGPRSALWIGYVRARGRGELVRFHWMYSWSDMGMWFVCRKRVNILQVAQNMYVVNRRVLCDLDGLENACFGGVWGQCEAQALRELGVSSP